jgi:hypothetical protein
MIKLELTLAGDPEFSLQFASAIASAPIENQEYSVSIKWSEPNPVLGATESYVELLGILGVLAFPLSVVSSIVGNLLTQRFARAKQMSSASARYPQLTISVTFLNDTASSAAEISLTQSNEEIRISLTNALLELADADHPPKR